MENKVYGAFANLYLKSDKQLDELSKMISEGLEMEAMRLENMDEEPYELKAYMEVFGFEMELCKTDDSKKYDNCDFLLQANTMDSFIEIHQKRMHDLSLWLARFITLKCKLVTLVVNRDSNRGIQFHYDLETFKVVSNEVKLM